MPLLRNRVTIPVIAVGGEFSLGSKVGDMVKLVAENVTTEIIADAGHFLPEERPEAVAQLVLSAMEKFA